jgi:hypothetical protein
MINKLKTLEHHHLIDGKYLKEDCIADVRARLEELVPSCLHDELDRVLASFEDDCVGYDVSARYHEKTHE